MDTVLKNSLFMVIYLNVVILIISSFCVKKNKTKTPEKVTEPPKRIVIQPRKIELNRKECLIKDGLQTGKHAYPTLDDIKSDWSEKGEKDEKKADKTAPDSGNVAKTAHLIPSAEEKTKDDVKDDEKKVMEAKDTF